MSVDEANLRIDFSPNSMDDVMVATKFQLQVSMTDDATVLNTRDFYVELVDPCF